MASTDPGSIADMGITNPAPATGVQASTTAATAGSAVAGLSPSGASALGLRSQLGYGSRLGGYGGMGSSMFGGYGGMGSMYGGLGMGSMMGGLGGMGGLAGGQLTTPAGIPGPGGFRQDYHTFFAGMKSMLQILYSGLGLFSFGKLFGGMVFNMVRAIAKRFFKGAKYLYSLVFLNKISAKIINGALSHAHPSPGSPSFFSFLVKLLFGLGILLFSAAMFMMKEHGLEEEESIIRAAARNRIAEQQRREEELNVRRRLAEEEMIRQWELSTMQASAQANSEAAQLGGDADELFKRLTTAPEDPAIAASEPFWKKALQEEMSKRGEGAQKDGDNAELGEKKEILDEDSREEMDEEEDGHDQEEVETNQEKKSDGEGNTENIGMPADSLDNSKVKVIKVSRSKKNKKKLTPPVVSEPKPEEKIPKPESTEEMSDKPVSEVKQPEKQEKKITITPEIDQKRRDRKEKYRAHEEFYHSSKIRRQIEAADNGDTLRKLFGEELMGLEMASNRLSGDEKKKMMDAMVARLAAMNATPKAQQPDPAQPPSDTISPPQPDSQSSISPAPAQDQLLVLPPPQSQPPVQKKKPWER